MRRARRLILAAAAGAMLLSGREWRAARADIILDPVPGVNRTALFLLNAGAGQVGDSVSYDAPPGFTSFTVPSPDFPISSFNFGPSSSRRGTSSGRAAGSTDTTIGLVDDVLTVQSTASFETEGSATPGEFCCDGGGGGVQLLFDLPIRITDRPYAYSLSGQVVSNSNMSVISGQGSRTNVIIANHSFGPIFAIGDITSFQTGSRTVPLSVSGAFGPSDITLQVRFEATGGQVFEAGHGFTNASLNFQFTLRPASHWINPAGGSFQGAANWTGQLVPDRAQDVAFFDLPGSYTVQLDQNVTHHGLQANGAVVNVTLDLDGNNYTLDEINIGGQDGDNVSLTFADSGGIVVSAASAAAGDGPAQAAANGAVRRLRAKLLKAGKGGTASVPIPVETTFGRIDKLGIVTVRTANGNWKVTDRLTVGADGGGGLIITEGGNVFSQLAVLGENASPDRAIVDIDGEGSSWDTENLIVGDRGDAVLTIIAKALVAGRHIVIGDKAGSSGDINVSGASLIQNAADDLTIGSRGRGKLNVTNGSLVEAGLLAIGLHSTGDGEVTVGSFAALGVSGSLSVGVNGTGKLTIDGQGGVNRTGPGLGSSFIGSGGSLDVRDGHFRDSSELIVDGILAINPTLGAVNVGQNLILNAGQLSVGPGGTLRGNGLIFGTVTVLPGGVNQFGGSVFPGASPGLLTIDGDFEQTGGLLGIEIAGTTPGQFDVLKVTGDATLGGDLLLQFIDGFAPQQGDEFMFLDIGGALSGAFANIRLRGLLPGFQFDLREGAGGLTMVALNDGIAVPEPASLALFIVVLLVAPFRRHVPRPLAA